MSDREEKKPRLEKMVDASEYKQKDTAINKLIKAFIPDNIYDLKDYIVSEIVIPTIKDGLDDTCLIWTRMKKSITMTSSSISIQQ